MKLAFALLAHGDPALVERLIGLLTAKGHCVAVHYDAKSPLSDFQRLTRRFAGIETVRFASRVKVGWAQWGVVQGALNCLHEIDRAGWNPDYVYHISGMDYPIRPSEQLVSFLKRHRGGEFIESVPADTVRWVKTGPQSERYRYYWWFNWRTRPKLTEFMFEAQKALRLERPFVRGITPHIGSQWWVLTWKTLKKIMELADQRDIVKFFKSTLAPDELFFQTLVRVVAHDAEISNCSLTLYQFSDYGYPVVYYGDHIDYLVNQPFFVARKISPHDQVVRDHLDARWHCKQSTRSLDDLCVGSVSQEYEVRRVAGRNGPPGATVIASTYQHEQRNINKISKPFFAVIGTSATELGFIQDILESRPETLCHGHLFHAKRCDFSGGRDVFAGYASQDTVIRDVDRAGFLSDVVRAESSRMSGFLLRCDAAVNIRDALAKAPNARLAIFPGDLVVAFLEHLLGPEVLSGPDLTLSMLETVTPMITADLFRRFTEGFYSDLRWLEDQAAGMGEGGSEARVYSIDDLNAPERFHQLLESLLEIQIDDSDRAIEQAVTEAGQRLELIQNIGAEFLLKANLPFALDEPIESYRQRSRNGGERRKAAG